MDDVRLCCGEEENALSRSAGIWKAFAQDKYQLSGRDAFPIGVYPVSASKCGLLSLRRRRIAAVTVKPLAEAGLEA